MPSFAFPSRQIKVLKLKKKKISTYFQIFAWVAPLVIHSLDYYSPAAEMKIISMNEHSFLMGGSRIKSATQPKLSNEDKR